MDERLTELEIRFTEQQDVIQSLSDTVYAQQRAIDALTLELTQLKSKVQEDPGLVDARIHERPPHY